MKRTLMGIVLSSLCLALCTQPMAAAWSEMSPEQKASARLMYEESLQKLRDTFPEYHGQIKVLDYNKVASSDPNTLFATKPVQGEEIPKEIYFERNEATEHFFDTKDVRPAYRQEEPGRIRTFYAFDAPLAHRRLTKSITLQSDQKVAYFNQLEIPENTTLTIGKGVTLTVEGEIIVIGTLVNNGTLVIAQRTAPEGQVFEEYTQSFIRSEGTFQNNGTLEITHGNLHNGHTAVNNGTIKVAVPGTVKGVTAITNSPLRAGMPATFQNNGAITLQNTGGTAVNNHSEATFQNNGTITKTKGTTLKGTIAGTKPVTEG